MPVNTTPIFTGTFPASSVSIATANTARDGTGTIGTVVTFGANGNRVDMVRVVAAGTTTAGVIRLWLHDGATYYLLKELLVTAITPSTTVAVFEAEWIPTVPLCRPTGWSLRVSTHNAETFKVHAECGDF